jgi:hypothetical protein
MDAAEIHHELCVVYGQNVMSEGTVRQWCRMFKDRRANVHDEEQSDYLFQSVDKQICERCHLTISELSCEFHKFHALFSTRLSQARLSQVVCKMGSENAHRCAHNMENGFGHERWR